MLTQFGTVGVLSLVDWFLGWRFSVPGLGIAIFKLWKSPKIPSYSLESLKCIRSIFPKLTRKSLKFRAMEDSLWIRPGAKSWDRAYLGKRMWKAAKTEKELRSVDIGSTIGIQAAEPLLVQLLPKIQLEEKDQRGGLAWLVCIVRP